MVICLRGDRVGDRIHQERHVVVDDADAHPAMAGLAAGRLDRDLELARLAPRRDLGEELGRFALSFSRQAMGLAGQGVARQRLANGLDQRLRQARMGSHELNGLRE